jgi:hypothetical protein
LLLLPIAIADIILGHFEFDLSDSGIISDWVAVSQYNFTLLKSITHTHVHVDDLQLFTISAGHIHWFRLFGKFVLITFNDLTNQK